MEFDFFVPDTTKEDNEQVGAELFIEEDSHSFQVRVQEGPHRQDGDVLRWKMPWYRNPDKKKQKLETFGFTSTKYPQTNRELWEFEADMMDLITKIEMKNYNNHLQEKMKEDKLKIRNSNKVVISADKTGNFYMVIFQC